MIDNKKTKRKEIIEYFFSAANLAKVSYNEQLNIFLGILYLTYSKRLVIDPVEIPNVDSCHIICTEPAKLIAIIEKKNPLLTNVLVNYVSKLKCWDSTLLLNSISSLVKTRLDIDDINQYYKEAKSVFMLDGQETAIHTQPQEITNLVARIMCGFNGSLFDPFAGLSSFVIGMPSVTRYVGIEIDNSTYERSIIFLAIAGMLDKSDVSCGNAGDMWPNGEKFDAVVTNPPFRALVEMKDGLWLKREFAEEIALRRFENITTSNGQMLTFVPASLLWNDSQKELRKTLCDKGYVDTILIFDNGLLGYTSIAVALVLLKKNRDNQECVKIVDASSALVNEGENRVLDVETVIRMMRHNSQQTITVSNKQLEANDWRWDFSIYDKIDDVIPEGYEKKTFSEVCENITSTPIDSGTNVPVLSHEDFDVEFTQKEITPRAIKLCDKPTKVYRLSEPALVISHLGAIRPAYVECSQTSPVYIRPTMWAFRIVDENVDWRYLCMKIRESGWLKNVMTSSGVPISHLGRMPLAFPSKVEQVKIFEESKHSYLLHKAEKMGLQALIDKMKQDILDEVRMRKHDMAPFMTQISSAELRMRKRLVNMEAKPEDKKFLEDRLDSMRGAIKKMSSLLVHLNDDTGFGKPEQFDVNKALDMFAQSNNGIDDIEVTYNVDLTAFLDFMQDENEESTQDEFPKAWIAPKDFNRVLDNIFANAKTHGYSNIMGEKKRKVFNIGMTLTDDNKFFKISFTNNGACLPQGIDKERYGIKGEKAGPNGVSGTGGYIVRTTVENYGGDYDVSSDNTSENKTTTITIYLPIYITE